MSSTFKPNRLFRRDYDRIFRHDPAAANVYLLICEIANERGQVMIEDEAEITRLFNARFNDPMAYQLEGGPGR